MPMPTPTQPDISRMIELVLGRHRVRPDDLLVENLGAESVDIANLVTALERKYGVAIAESDLPALRTPRDFFELVRDGSR